jgi:PBP1b-binding outer membrane lipoprotein LpoB
MKRIIEFINKYGMVIIVPLILIMFLKTCSTNGRVDGVSDEIEMTNQKVDTLKFEIQKEIRVEGLRSEKRMIQSISRTLIDRNREREIDKEIENLLK